MKLTFPDNLTVEEQAEFTCVNMLAHNILREFSKDKQPLWLCMSDEAKQEAREKAAEWFNKNSNTLVPFGVKNQSEIQRLEKCVKPAIGHMLQQWVDMESQMKSLRAENNPRAFFCP